MNRDWMSVWYTPDADDHIAYISLERIAEIGGALLPNWTAHQITQGNAKLAQWCRVNCKTPGTPVNVRGRYGWAFKHLDDAVLFKLTWG